MFDFKNVKKSPLVPPAFVSDKATGYFSASWDMQLALKSAGHVIDMFAQKEGAFSDALDSLQLDLEVDLLQVIEQFDNEFVVTSDSDTRNGDESIAFAFRLKGDADYVIDNIKKSFPIEHKLVQFQNLTIIEIVEAVDDEEFDVVWADPVDPVEEGPFLILEKKFYATSDGYLFVANNLNYLKNILQSRHDTISDSNDNQRVAASLEKITDSNKISFRQFSRLDRVVRSNYELMRTGKMPAGQTVLSRLINHLIESAPDRQRAQEIDGSRLPPDFDTHVAPHLGPSGLVMEMADDGWLFTGVVLDRK